MELLDNNLEQLLKTLLENDTNYLTKDDCYQYEIDALIEKGFFTKKDVSTLSGWEYIVEPTQMAKCYFQNKGNYCKTKKFENQKQALRFWIPVAVSIGSLIVAIIALCK